MIENQPNIAVIGVTIQSYFIHTFDLVETTNIFNVPHVDSTVNDTDTLGPSAAQLLHKVYLSPYHAWKFKIRLAYRSITVRRMNVMVVVAEADDNRSPNDTNPPIFVLLN